MKKILAPCRALQFAATALLVASPTVVSQCQLDWQPGMAIAGPSGRVNALANLPSGDLVVAGRFLEAGPVLANRVARWDGVQWHALGSGVNDLVLDMAVAANGDVYVVGEFTEAGGLPANGIARWDGTAWSTLGQGFDDIVHCIELLPSGHLVAGGAFQASGTTAMPLLAEWDGAAWSSFGSGLSGTQVTSITAMPNGGLAVGGDIYTAGSSPASRVAIWDGAGWSGVPGLQPFVVSSLAAGPNGDLAIAAVASGNPVSYLSIWNGTTLQTIADTATPVGPTAGAQLVYSSSGVLTSVSTSGGNPGTEVLQWNGAVWTRLGGLIDTSGVALLEQPSGGWIVAGGLDVLRAARVRALRTFDGSDWSDWGPAVEQPLMLAEGPQGELYSATSSASVGGSAVQRWNGVQWQSAGVALLGSASSLAIEADGSLLAGGRFPRPAGGGEDLAMRWDGQQWSSITIGLSAVPSVLAVSPDATAFAGMNDGTLAPVMSFDGNQWNPVGTALTGRTSGMAFLPNGDLLVSGELYLSSLLYLPCARWDGNSWSAFGPAMQQFGRRVLVRPAGDVVLASGTGQVLLGDGVTWTPLGGPFNSLILDLDLMPNGDLLASGAFDHIGTAQIAGLARWDGVAWQAAVAGSPIDGDVFHAGFTGDGELHVTGDFTRLGGAASAGRGRARTNCPGNSVPYGNGCIGPAGPLALAALDAPWVGASYRVRAYGMPTASLALHAIGLNLAAIALPPILPQSLPGCELLTSSEMLEVVLPNAGIAEPRLQLPSEVSLIGAGFFQQVLAVQIGLSGELLTVSSSNGLAATIGAF